MAAGRRRRRAQRLPARARFSGWNRMRAGPRVRRLLLDSAHRIRSTGVSATPGSTKSRCSHSTSYRSSTRQRACPPPAPRSSLTSFAIAAQDLRVVVAAEQANRGAARRSARRSPGHARRTRIIALSPQRDDRADREAASASASMRTLHRLLEVTNGSPLGFRLRACRDGAVQRPRRGGRDDGVGPRAAARTPAWAP